jgi:lipopolysaccharide transport system ATP-binding protein
MLTGLPRYAYNKLRPARPILDAGSARPASGRGAGGEGQGESNLSEERASDFWALRDVSFEVQPGEVVGIIGRNGAGKSTLLKVLSRITEPTSGRFGVRGRVASLLEVGTGFHPELTGRENIYVSGITLGMTRAEVKKRFDEIVDFSGVEKFLEMPVKHYSSGMQVRLGFAVAAHLESEILIIDEVLAVGDAEFQKKCFGKLKSLIALSGRAVLLVSHNAETIRTFCERAIWLNDGQVVDFSTSEKVVSNYTRILTDSRNASLSIRSNRRGNGKARFVAVEFQVNDNPCENLMTGSHARVVLTIDSTICGEAEISLGINNWQETRILLLSNLLTREKLQISIGPNRIAVTIDCLQLVPGNYSSTLFLAINDQIEDWIIDAANISVIAGEYNSNKTLPKPGEAVIVLDHSLGVI